MSRSGVWRCVIIVSIVCVIAVCLKSGPAVHPHGPASAEPLLLRASGACLAKIAKLEEHNDSPSDGLHRIEVWLEIEESSGMVPKFLPFTIHLGLTSPEAHQKFEAQKANMVLRHDSLQVGERHWFVFSDDYDATKYPYQVAGWWWYSDGDVPKAVVQAIQKDRFGSPSMRWVSGTLVVILLGVAVCIWWLRWGGTRVAGDVPADAAQAIK